MFLGWAVRARGEDALPSMVAAFVAFTHEANCAQARYEVDGHYLHSSFAECYEECYGQDRFMEDYLWGVYLTNFLWAHHVDIALFYEDRFLSRLSPSSELVEIAPGHGGWGVWALSQLRAALLKGYDISPRSIGIARSVAAAAGVAARSRYEERDALDLDRMPAESADACICSFLVEHLEEPERLFCVVHDLLRPHGCAFITGALTAAQIDHIAEFRRESELVLLCEKHGLRVLEALSVNPRRTLPGARFLPRSIALLVTRRVNDIW